jgi:tRNA-uridine 2-sulfurtransferase
MAERIIVGLSGGVDSAVAALLLVRAGRDVHGLHMSNWEEDEAGHCSAAADFQAAQSVARELGIPLHRVSFAAEYRERVFADFLAGYAAGHTPNPDVLCNREVKFGVCLEYARRLGGRRFATGHYARIDRAGGRPRLLRARDRAKDQCYFLQQVPAAALAAVEFPLGELGKGEVRELARRAGLPVHDRPDSTGICFIGERPFRAFLGRYLAVRPGPIETAAGERVGTHEGLPFHTIGQRQGLKVGGRAGHAEAPWYVAAKDLGRNTLVVVQGHEHALLMATAFEVAGVAWLATPGGASFACSVQVRHRSDAVPCQVALDGTRVAVTPQAPVRAVATGQYAAFFAGEECLGGGVISGVTTAVTPHAAAPPALRGPAAAGAARAVPAAAT